MFIIRRKLFTTDIPSVIELSRRGERKGTELLYYGKKKKLRPFATNCKGTHGIAECL